MQSTAQETREIAIANRSSTFSLTPQSLNEAIELSKMMAESDLVPKDYKGKSGNVLIAVQMGAEVGLAPMAAIQNIAVINGKPSLYGDAGKAILLANGCQIIEDDIKKIKEQGFASCTIIRRGQSTTRTFGLDNAKTAGLLGKDGPWKNHPERQLAWRAFWFAARDAAADLLKGLGGKEEVQDYPQRERDITSEGETLPISAKDRLHEAVTKSQPAATEEPEVTLDQVKEAISTMSCREEFDAADALFRKLKDEGERTEARNLFAKRIETLRSQKQQADAGNQGQPGAQDAAAGEPPITFASVESALRAAAKERDRQKLDDAAATINSPGIPLKQQKELNVIYQDCVREIDEKF